MSSTYSENIKIKIDNKLKKNPELLYHIDNPFLEKYIDIVTEAICDEISLSIEKSVSEVENKIKNNLKNLNRFKY